MVTYRSQLQILLQSLSNLIHYRPQRSCGQGNVFTGVCLSTGGEGVCLSACWDAIPPRTRETPPGPGRPPWDQADPPRDQVDPPRPGRPPWDQADPPGTRQAPLGSGRPPRTRQTPQPPHPPREADSSIWSTSGRYASYWNAFLLIDRVWIHGFFLVSGLIQRNLVMET